MRITLLLCGFMMLAIGLSGCVEDGSRQQIADDLSKSESQVFPDQAVWMGDEGGYHYVRVRSIYSYCGDTDYRIPVKDWALADPFPRTDNASQWRNVQWEDSGIFHQSRFAYVLYNSREKLDAADAQMLQKQSSTPTTEPMTAPSGPTTQPASQP
ncbi:MAG TPA: hypothetical protein VH370_02225 [Humisphaera sp.]|nr:hypothetical protein [Humisphaera sp.]